MAVATKNLTASLLGLCWLWSTPVQAQTPAPPTPAPSTSEAHPFVAELHTGLNDPLGRFGLALAYDRAGRLSAGVGLGLDSMNREVVVGASLFGRVRLLRLGSFTLDTGGILSRGNHQTSRTNWQGDSLTWTWGPDYRITGTLGVGLGGRHWSIRLESGLGYRLNRPTCDYDGYLAEFHGTCNSREIPDEYHSSNPPDRLSMSFSLALGYRLGVEDDVAVAESHGGPDYRSPSKALRLSIWSTALPSLFGAAMISLAYSNWSDNVAMPVIGGLGLGLGLSFGPGVGYAYAGEHGRAWALGILRVLGFGVGSIFIYGAAWSSVGEYYDRSKMVTYGVLGITFMGASLFSAGYDIITAPRAAKRANARHGLTNISLLPVPIAGPKSVGPGLALGGRF